MSLSRLHKRTALVTGGSSGIGRAVCELFAREGANVAVLGKNFERLFETLNSLSTNHGNKHCIIQADVSSAGDIERSFKEAEKELGEKFNILINNAGIMKANPLDGAREQDFDDIIGTNLKGCFLVNKKFLMSISEKDRMSRKCCIVNVSSLASVRGIPIFACYAASKSGMNGLTKCIASDYQRHKVRCNAVIAGMTETPALAEVGEQFAANLIPQIPMQRIAQPEEIANACLYLASDESSYVNGALLEVDGGLMT